MTFSLRTVIDAGILAPKRSSPARGRCIDFARGGFSHTTSPEIADPAADRDLDDAVGPRYIWSRMTPREKLHLLVDELSDAEAEAAFARLVRERELLRQWTEAEDTDATEDAWALANAREAIREERW
jgi:hypothetical protein